MALCDRSDLFEEIYLLWPVGSRFLRCLSKPSRSPRPQMFRAACRTPNAKHLWAKGVKLTRLEFHPGRDELARSRAGNGYDGHDAPLTQLNNKAPMARGE